MKAVQTILVAGFALVGMLSFRTYPGRQLNNVSAVTKIDTVKIDVETGLVNDTNLMMVKSQCTACHSSKLILQHRFTRAGWLERIRWMQKYHKLWDLGESENVVLDYLEKNYGPQSAGNVHPRRAPLKNSQWYKLSANP